MSENRLKQLGKSFRTKQIWPKSAVFECSCGNRVVLRTDCVNSNKTKSCGCLTKEIRADKTKNKKAKEPRKTQKHGMSKTPEYRSWSSMINRCTSDTSSNYKNYKGRSITVCERWLIFSNFLEDMGKRPDQMSIDRIDNEKGYSPENCRWSTRSEQGKNKRSYKTTITIGNETKTIKEWGKYPDTVGSATILRRIIAGFTPEEAVFNRRATWSKMK